MPNDPLPQSGGSYIVTEEGELVRVDPALPAPFPETLTETPEADNG